LFGFMPDLVLAILKRTSPSADGALLTQVTLSFLAMIVPTTIIGATFPCAVQLCARALPRLGRDVGQVYSANTAGTIAGALTAGFLLIPWLGAETSMIAAAGLNIAVGGAVLAASAPVGSARRRTVAIPLVVLFAIAIVILPRWDRRVMMGGAAIYVKQFAFAANPAQSFRAAAASRQLLLYREGINATVAVERTDRITALKVDGKVDASNGVDMMTQVMLGHLPVLLHTHPERVLVIGLGSGVTVGAVAQHPAVKEIDVVEMEPAVIEASKFFARENRNVLRDPRVRAVVGDGRNFLLAGEKRYDIISSEPSNPWMAGVANLFSLEFYRLARSRLAADGIMVQWVHGYSLFPAEFKMILNTFRQVFPHATLWRTLSGDYFLVGRSSPLAIDYALLSERFTGSATVAQDLAAFRLDSPLDLLTLFLLDEADLARFAAGAAQNTDDRPLLEFAAPKALYADTMEINARLLAEARTVDLPTIINLPGTLLEARRLHFAQLYWARGEKGEALKQLDRAPATVDIAARLERAKLLFSLGEVSRAMEDLARIQPQNNLIKSYLKAGAILHRMKAEHGIMGHGRTRLGDPNPAEAFNNLGNFYTKLGIQFAEPAFFDLAVDSLEAALRIEPQAHAVLNNLANAYFELGRFDEAATSYRHLIGLMPERAELRFNLGLVYEKQDRIDLATKEIERAMGLNPQWGAPKLALNRLRAKAAVAVKANKTAVGTRKFR
jgi:spermidine synthase